MTWIPPKLPPAQDRSGSFSGTAPSDVAADSTPVEDPLAFTPLADDRPSAAARLSPIHTLAPSPRVPRSVAGREEWRSRLYAGPTDRQLAIRSGVTPIDEQTAEGVRPGEISLLHQGSTNACGTTTLSMILRFWQGSTQANTVEAIDRSIRPGNSPTEPRDIKAYARSQGLRAGVIRGGTPAHLVQLINQGTPPMIVTYAGSQMHYVAVTGYERTIRHGEPHLSFTLADPSAGVRTVSRAELEQAWTLGYLISIAPSGSQAVATLDGRPRRADQLVVFDSPPNAVDAAASIGVDIVGLFTW